MATTLCQNSFSTGNSHSSKTMAGQDILFTGFSSVSRVDAVPSCKRKEGKTRSLHSFQLKWIWQSKQATWQICKQKADLQI